MAKETDIKRLTDRMMAGDVEGCYKVMQHLFEVKQCGFCEVWGDVRKCRAPGCTALGCPECLAFHSLAHIEDDPKDQRPI